MNYLIYIKCSKFESNNEDNEEESPKIILYTIVLLKVLDHYFVDFVPKFSLINC